MSKFIRLKVSPHSPVRLVNLDQIVTVEENGNKIVLTASNGQRYDVEMTCSEFEAFLESDSLLNSPM